MKILMLTVLVKKKKEAVAGFNTMTTSKQKL